MARSISAQQVSEELGEIQTVSRNNARRPVGVSESAMLDHMQAESMPVLGLEERREQLQFATPAMAMAEAHDLTQHYHLSEEFPDLESLFSEPTLKYADTTIVNDVDVAPYNAAGRIVFNTPGGGSAHGSAWICGPQLVATAAHNLVEVEYNHFGGIRAIRYSKNAYFYPGFDAYHDGEVDRYRVTSVKFHHDYINMSTNTDIALCRVDRSFPESIAPLPIVPVDYDFFDNNEVRALAYPGGAAFDFGQKQWECKGKYLFSESGDSTQAKCPVKASTLGPGCSGGAWVSLGDDGWVAVGLSSGPASKYLNPFKRGVASTKSPIFDAQTINRLYGSTRNAVIQHDRIT